MWLLILNDMRAPKSEEGDRAWARAHTQEALEAFVNAEKVESYQEVDGTKTWVKYFRKGGPLEWANNSTTNDSPMFAYVPPKAEFMQEASVVAGKQWDNEIAPLPLVGEDSPDIERIKEAFYQAAVEFSPAYAYANTEELEATVDQAWENYAAKKELV